MIVSFLSGETSYQYRFHPCLRESSVGKGILVERSRSNPDIEALVEGVLKVLLISGRCMGSVVS